MTDPAPNEVEEICRSDNRLLVPTDFDDVLSSGSVVFELDRRWPGCTGRCRGTDRPGAER